jgi:Na+/H+-dicarboxylate symporter
MKKLALHWQILLGMAFGVLFGFLAIQFSWGQDFVVDWIKPFGTIFIKTNRGSVDYCVSDYGDCRIKRYF